MTTFGPFLLTIITVVVHQLLLPVYGIPSVGTSKNIFDKSSFGYYPPAEPDYPPITVYPPSARLPASSRFDFERDGLMMPRNPDQGKIYGDHLMVRVSSAPHPDNFNLNDENEPAPTSFNSMARYYLKGAQLQKIKTPACRLTACHGPYPNDGSLLINKDKGASNEECEQFFVQMNGCVADKGYPVGMVCTICCQCTKQFIHEMSNSRAFREGINWLVK